MFSIWFLAFPLVLLLPHFASPVSFVYPFHDNNIVGSDRCTTGIQKLCLNDQATIDPASSIIGLTNDTTYASGSVYYSEPLHLWDTDTTTGELLVTNFTTTFSFYIEKNSPYDYQYDWSDGIVFFLTTYPFHFLSSGGSFGLINDSGQNLNGTFISIEIDTHQNEWDPISPHLGIDVDSLVSVANETITGATNNLTGVTQINYNSVTGNLSVNLECLGLTYHLSHVVNLSQVLPKIVAFGISGSCGYPYAQLTQISSWNFSSSLDAILEARSNPNAIHQSSTNISPTSAPTMAPMNEGKKEKKKKKTLVMVTTIVVVLVGILGMLFFAVWLQRVRKEEEEDSEEEGFVFDDEAATTAGPRRFAFQHLVDATRNFEQARKLGAGGSGAVYQGFLKDMNCDVAIKRICKTDSKQGRREYRAEIEIISQLRHRNLVQLMGWSHKKGEFLLVYELMPNLSLDHHLFSANKVLPWELRYNIAHGVGTALLYLHEGCLQCIVHRDIKSSNIMLDNDFNAKLGDFGLARVVNHGATLQTTIFGGTMGYIAPECFYTGKASKESDVYAFGVVALEIATGQKSIQETEGSEGAVYLVHRVWNLYENGALLEAADRRLENIFDSRQMERLLIVGLWCSQPDVARRPPIGKAMAALNSEDTIIDLPPRMPVPRYDAPQVIPGLQYLPSASFSHETALLSSDSLVI